MERTFELILPNTGRLLAIWLSGLAAGVALAVALGKGTELSNDTVFVVLMALLLGGGYGLFRLTKKYGSRPTQVALTPDSLTVLDRPTGQSRRVAFADIASYRFSAFNGAEELRIKLLDGSKHKIGINTNLHDDQSLTELVQAFEAALALHRPAGQEGAVIREKTFFEKKISTVILIVFGAFMAWAVWMIIESDKPIRGNMFTALASFIAYVVAWYRAREQRRA